MAGENAAIWIVASGAGDGLEATASAASVDNVLLFNEISKVVGSGGANISDIDVDFRKAIPENEAVSTDNNEIQDMGIDGFDVTITAITGNTDNDATSNAVNKLSLWLQNSNGVAGYSKGRFGLRLDNAPQWNVVPTSTLGMHIRNVNFKYIGEKKDQCLVVIQLSLGGDIQTAI